VPANLSIDFLLALEIVGALFAGQHPIGLTRPIAATEQNLPNDWKEQRRFLGFDA